MCYLQALHKALPGESKLLPANSGWYLKRVWRWPYVNETLFYDRCVSSVPSLCLCMCVCRYACIESVSNHVCIQYAVCMTLTKFESLCIVYSHSDRNLELGLQHDLYLMARHYDGLA